MPQYRGRLARRPSLLVPDDAIASYAGASKNSTRLSAEPVLLQGKNPCAPWPVSSGRRCNAPHFRITMLAELCPLMDRHPVPWRVFYAKISHRRLGKQTSRNAERTTTNDGLGEATVSNSAYHAKRRSHRKILQHRMHHATAKEEFSSLAIRPEARLQDCLAF